MPKFLTTLLAAAVMIIGLVFSSTPSSAAANDVPSVQPQTDTDEFMREMTMACGEFERTESYLSCADQFAAAHTQGNYVTPGIHSNRGARFDQARDELYGVARMAGNAWGCGVLSMDQADFILHYQIGKIFPDDRDGPLEAHALDIAGDGFYDKDCSLWRRHPERIKAEKSLAHLAMVALDR